MNRKPYFVMELRSAFDVKLEAVELVIEKPETQDPIEDNP